MSIETAYVLKEKIKFSCHLAIFITKISFFFKKISEFRGGIADYCKLMKIIKL